MKDIEDRLNRIEFRQDLLFENTPISRLLYEYNISETEYTAIMDLMDEYRTKIESRKNVSSAEFEQRIYELVPSVSGDYHFCEYIAKEFAEDGRWEEVFPSLYGHLPKYK